MKRLLHPALIILSLTSLIGAEEALLSDALTLLGEEYHVETKQLVGNVPVRIPKYGEDIPLEQVLLTLCQENGYRYRIDQAQTEADKPTAVIAQQWTVNMEMEDAKVIDIIRELEKTLGRYGDFCTDYHVPDLEISIKWDYLLVSKALEDLAYKTGGKVRPIRRYSEDSLADITWLITWRQ